MTLRIGSLFSGYGGLDMGVQAVLGGEMAWHCQYDPEDRHQYAARILAHHWPKVPNLGDITRVCWACVLEEYGPVDVLTGGFPCTDLSLAGKRAGIAEGTRSGLWLHMARAIQALRPRLVVIENVRGLLSQKADRGVDTRSEDLVRTGGAKLVLRALGAVLGDLAGLGFDAEWAGVRASEVGAPHERFREFVIAWPADADGAGLEGRGVQGAVAEHVAPVAHAHGRGRCAGGGFQPVEPQRLGDGRPGYEVGAAAADADLGGRAALGELPAGRDAVRGGVRADVDGCGAPAAADTDGGVVRQQPVGESGRGGAAVARRGGAQAAADPSGVGRREGRAESAGQRGRSDAAECGGAAAADPSGVGHRDPWSQGERGLAAAAVASGAAARVGQRDDRRIDWGEYGPAIAQWETILGRPHPWPTNDRGQLAAEFDEWMMGLPEGHLCSVPPAPGMTEAALRNARVKAAGNGVVPLQAAAAVRLLLDRVAPEVPIVWQLIEEARADMARAA